MFYSDNKIIVGLQELYARFAMVRSHHQIHSRFVYDGQSSSHAGPPTPLTCIALINGGIVRDCHPSKSIVDPYKHATIGSIVG